MTRLLQPLFALFSATTDDKLRQMVEYLKEENAILRAKLPKTAPLTAHEKNRLIKLGSAVGRAIKNLVTIVSYRTFCRWTAAVAGPPLKNARAASTRKPGRPRTAEDVRALVLKIARENGWGYTRVLGELKKLGVHTVSRTTVKNILTDAGLDPGPKRGAGTWDEFVTRHAATLWASDFVSVRTLTAAGLVDLYLLFVRHDSREGIADPVSRTLGRRCLSRPTYSASKDDRGTQPVGEAAVEDEVPGPRAARLAKNGEGYTA